MPTTPSDGPPSTLQRRLGRGDIISMGVGAIVGAGIFVTTGVAAATKAGPAIMVSFVLAGAICVLIALCYSELAAMTPRSGSAYTYTRQALGDKLGFMVGWTLLLELVVAGAAVAIGWSGLLTAALKSLFGVTLPTAITAGPSGGGIINLPAVLIIAAIVGILVFDVRMTATVVKALVILTIGVLVLVVVIGAPHVTTEHWTPFAPFGVHGIAAGAALAFFAYLGFDIVATSAEETKNPARDMPWGIIGSVVIATILYIGVSAVLTGVAPYQTLNNEAPVATALSAIGAGWIGDVILVASVLALTKGLLMLFYGQTRLVFAMCRDGMLPRGLAATTKRGAPRRLGIIVGVLGAVIAGLLPIDTVAELVNVGALFAFSVVAVGVVVLRYREPKTPRPFRVPMLPVVSFLAVAGCLWLLSTLEPLTWVRFAVWTAVGIAVYMTYSRRHNTIGFSPSATTDIETAPPGRRHTPPQIDDTQKAQA